jgi:hypothetical protein
MAPGQLYFLTSLTLNCDVYLYTILLGDNAEERIHGGARGENSRPSGTASLS